MKQIIQKILTSVDVYAQEVQLMIMGKTKFSSKIGSLSSILIMFPCLLLLIDDILSTINKENPNVFFIQKEQQIAPTYYFDQNNFSFVFLVTDPNFNGLKITDNIYNVNHERKLTKHIKQLKISLQEIQKLILSCSAIPMSTCTIDHFQTDAQYNYFKNYKYYNMYCIDRDWWKINKPYLSGFGSSNVFVYLQLQVKQCRNSSNYNKCAPQEIIDSKLQAAYAISYISSYLIDNSIKENPYQLNTELRASSISIQSSKIDVHYYAEDTTYSDIGLFSTQQNSYDVPILKQTQALFDPVKQSTFYTALFQLNNVQTITYRVYPKIQTILGSIGGLWSILFTVTSLIVNPIIGTLMKTSLIFDLEKYKVIINNEIFLPLESGPRGVTNMNSPQNSQMFQPLDSGPRGEVNINSPKHTEQVKKQLKDNILESQNYKSRFKKKIDDLYLTFRHLLPGSKSQSKKKLDILDHLMDIRTIVQKFAEFDVLKQIILNEDQLNILEFISSHYLFSNQNEKYSKGMQNQKDGIKSSNQTQISYQKVIAQQSDINTNISKLLESMVINLQGYPQCQSIQDFLVDSESKAQPLKKSEVNQVQYQTKRVGERTYEDTQFFTQRAKN